MKSAIAALLITTATSLAQQRTVPFPGTAKSLEVKMTTPRAPATLATGERFIVSVHYNNTGQNPVRITARPVPKGKKAAPQIFLYGGNEYAPGSGDALIGFGLYDAGVVDGVSVEMVDTKTKQVVGMETVPARLEWKGPTSASKPLVLPPYNPDFGQTLVAIASLSNPQSTPPSPGNKTMDVGITVIKAPAKLSPTKEIILYANPGKNFKVGVTVKFKSPSPTKLAANLLLEEAKILPPEFVQQLKEYHNTTWHFDTESRPGYQSAEGEKEMTFDLIGFAPKEKGKYTFTLSVGLFEKKTWKPEVLKEYAVTLVTDKKLFDEAGTASNVAAQPVTTTAHAQAGIAPVPPATPPTVTATIDASDTAAINAAIGKIVAVKGRVQNVTTSKTGSIDFINFSENARGAFVGIVQQENREAVVAALGSDLKTALAKKTIELRGEIVLYKNEHPQIVVSSASQIKVLE